MDIHKLLFVQYIIKIISWVADCEAKEKYSEIFGDSLKDPKLWFDLDRWTNSDDINNKIVDILHNLFDLLKQHENEILEVKS